MTKRIALWAAGIAAFAIVLVGVISASGLRFYTVMTPSMGQAAPVGTLVVTRPALNNEAGEIVTYERDRRSYTHRIIEVNPDGTFVTKGDLNGAADPLPVAKAQIRGQAMWIVPGFGWLWQGLPWLILGGLLVYALSLFGWFRGNWRWVVRISGWTLVFCLVALWLRPWVSLTQLSWSPFGADGVNMHVVNTGMFPLDALGERLVMGQDAIVHVTEQNYRGEYTLTPTLAFHWWEQIVLFLLCLIPLGLSLLIKDDRPAEPARAIEDAHEVVAENETVGLDSLLADGDGTTTGAIVDAASETAVLHEVAAAEPPVVAVEDTEARDERSEHRRRLILIAAIVLAIIIGVAVVTLTPTSAALTAKVTNSTNTAATRTFFNCRNAITSLPGQTYLAWAMGTSGNSETDIANTINRHTGAYNPTVSTTVSDSGGLNASIGCLHDTPARSVNFLGNRCLYVNANYAASAPTTFSVEAWFRTTTTALNGKIIGLGSSRNTVSETEYDRHIYLDNMGRVIFGIYDGAQRIVASPAGHPYNDGKWHHVVGTFSSATGMDLYVDGSPAASAAQATINADAGYWKVGCGTLSTWANGSGATTTEKPAYFTGQIQYAAVFTKVLSAAEVQQHYLAGVS